MGGRVVLIPAFLDNDEQLIADKERRIIHTLAVERAQYKPVAQLTAGGSAFTFDLLTFLILIRLFLVTTKRRSI